MIEYLDRAQALGRLPDAVLIDAYVPGQPGGTGVIVADEVLDSIPPLPRLILAGGLTPENVAARVARVRPWMVDVASGVEQLWRPEGPRSGRCIHPERAFGEKVSGTRCRIWFLTPFARLPFARGISAVGRPIHDIRMKPVFEYRASAARETVDKRKRRL